MSGSASGPAPQPADSTVKRAQPNVPPVWLHSLRICTPDSVIPPKVGLLLSVNLLLGYASAINPCHQQACSFLTNGNIPSMHFALHHRRAVAMPSFMDNADHI